MRVTFYLRAKGQTRDKAKGRPHESVPLRLRFRISVVGNVVRVLLLSCSGPTLHCTSLLHCTMEKEIRGEYQF